MKTFGLICRGILCAALLGLAFTTGCSPHEAPAPFSEYTNIRSIDLSFGDMEHLLEIATATIQDKSYEKMTDEHRVVYSPQSRGVFLTRVFPNERAKTTFAFGESLEIAVVHASKLMTRLCLPTELKDLRLRVDVVDKTSDTRSTPLDKRWHWDMAHEGLIFGTDPVVPTLPQELMAYEVFKSPGEYRAAGMRRLVKERVIGDIVRESFQEDQEPDFVQFSSKSFIQNPAGGITLLYGVNRYDMPVNSDTVREAIRQGAGYLVRTRPDNSGQFNYRFYPQRNLDSSSYNTLRHAGTVYSLYKAYAVLKDPDVLEAANAGLEWITKSFRGPRESDKAAVADFVAFPETDGKDAKSGGAGLALLALAEQARVTGNKDNLESMRGLARFIAFNTAADGSLAGKYYFDREAAKPFSYPYYASECAAGLVALYGIDPDPAWLDLATRLLVYQRDVRDKDKSDTSITQDQWFILAVEGLQAVRPETDLVEHAYRIGTSMQDKQMTDAARPDLVGAFNKVPSSTSTASRAEAMLSLMRISKARGEMELFEKFKKAAVLAAGIELRLQYNDDNVSFFITPEKALGGFMDAYDSPTIQIDYIQHNLCALTELLDVLQEPVGSNAPTAIPVP